MKAHGINAASITYDSREVLSNFGDAHKIEYPLLSDVGSKVIRAFGILNTNVPEDHKMMYGMPWPGDYLIAPDSAVRDKLFLRSYEHRPSASQVVLRHFDNAGGNSVDSVARGHGAIGRFSNCVVVRDQVNVSAASGTVSASANNVAIARSRHEWRAGAGSGMAGSRFAKRAAVRNMPPVSAAGTGTEISGTRKPLPITLPRDQASRRKTITGAWSEGFSPLRSLRSMRLAVHRAASGADNRM